MDENVQRRTVGVIHLDSVLIVGLKPILAAIQSKITDDRFVVGREFRNGRQLQYTSKALDDLIAICSLPLHPVLVMRQVEFVLPFGAIIIHVKSSLPAISAENL